MVLGESRCLLGNHGDRVGGPMRLRLGWLGSAEQLWLGAARLSELGQKEARGMVTP